MIDKIKKWWKKFRCPHIILQTELEGLFCYYSPRVITAKLPYNNERFELLYESFNNKQKVSIDTNEFFVDAYITRIEVKEYNSKKYMELYFLICKQYRDGGLRKR